MAVPRRRPTPPPRAAARLARAVCADVGMVAPADVLAIARAVADAQADQIASAIVRVTAAIGERVDVIATGLGTFLAHRAAARAGLASRDLNDVLAVDVGWAAPAAAIAWLLAHAPSPAG